MTSRIAALLIAITCTFAAHGQSADATSDLAALEKRRAALYERQPTPRRFVDESIALADAYIALAKRTSPRGSRGGPRFYAISVLSNAAVTTRFELKDPRRAIELYRRALAAVEQQNDAASYEDIADIQQDIADIQQFDLKDRAAAAATLKTARDANAAAMEDNRAAWYHWKAQWLEAELRFLESGRTFNGTVDAAALAGFVGWIYSGVRVLMDPALDPGLDIHNPPVPPGLEKKLLALPPSHTAFRNTWMYAGRLRDAATVQKWLTRNDPAGFWAASFLTLVAVIDRDLKAVDPDHARIVNLLTRDKNRRPTGVALLAREYAKTHELPPRGTLDE